MKGFVYELTEFPTDFEPFVAQITYIEPHKRNIIVNKRQCTTRKEALVWLDDQKRKNKTQKTPSSPVSTSLQ